MRNHLSRRAVLKSGAVLPFATIPALPGTARAARLDARPEDGVRNIIFMVSDGMCAGVPSLAEPFSQLVRGKRTQWHALADDRHTVRGFFETASLDSMVTDSAAASSAWGSGSRVNNGAINTLPDGRRLTTIAELARSAGRAVGLVTTTTVTHATPAGFAAVEADRGKQDAIAPQYLDRVDVILGGGRAHFDPAVRTDRRDVFEEYRRRGYAICATRDELAGVPAAGPLLGVFWPGHLPYTIDQVHRPREYASVPTLEEMTRCALDRLAGAPRGFLLQVEGGRVDHAGHSNDAAALLWDQLAFDDAIAVALAFVERNPDTLLVVTTDHGTANPGLNGMGAGYRESTACFERVAGISSSAGVVRAALGRKQADQIGDGPENDAQANDPPPMLPVDDVIDIVHEHTRIRLAPSEAEAVARARSGLKIPDLNGQHTGMEGALGQALANHIGIAWTGTSHTNELAITLATGRGREHFAGVQHHTEVFRILTGLMGASV